MGNYLFANDFVKVFKTRVKWTLNKNFPALFFSPHMQRDEYLLFRTLCRDRKFFLEFGSGGSTIFFLKEKKEVFSVESNPGFFQLMNSISIVKKALNKNLNYRFVDLGKTNRWGKPILQEDNANWPDYYLEVWKDIDPARQKIDAIFIDGRFRVSCCLYSVLKVVEYGWDDTLFIIHDFWRREKYHPVLEFLSEVKSASNLASFRVRKNVNLVAVKSRLEQFAFDYS